jgi:hypothetical protein
MREICAAHWGHAAHMTFAVYAFFQRLVCNRREELESRAVVERALVFWPVPGERNFVPSSSRPTGFPTQIGHNGPEPDPVVVRPLSTQWLSDEQIAEARRVWSKAYGRVISEDEAIEIVMNVRRLAEVLLRAEGEKEEP